MFHLNLRCLRRHLAVTLRLHSVSNFRRLSFLMSPRRHIERMVPHVATAISYGILFNELFRNIICFTSILCVLLWVFVSLLVNGPLFLPTATVVGLGAFLMYRVRYHFETARVRSAYLLIDNHLEMIFRLFMFCRLSCESSSRSTFNALWPLPSRTGQTNPKRKS